MIKLCDKVCCYYNNMHDASMSVFFIDTSLSKHVDKFFNIGFSLGDKRGLSLGELIVHFVSCFPTIIYNVFMHNNALWSNSNAFSLIICKVYTKRENAGSWNSGP